MKFNRLIPELAVSNLKKSLNFYVDILGFKIEYERKESKFVFLSLNGSQIMIQESADELGSKWFTGNLEHPFGRGIHFQIEVRDISPLLASLKKNKYPVKSPPEEYWFRQGNIYLGAKGFLVMDPDGYLLMCQKPLDRY